VYGRSFAAFFRPISSNRLGKEIVVRSFAGFVLRFIGASFLILFVQRGKKYFKKRIAFRMTTSYFPWQMRLKRSHEKVVRTTISLPPMLLDFGLQASQRAGYTTFSAYVQELLRERAKNPSRQYLLAI
jgi:hypothetical protein